MNEGYITYNVIGDQEVKLVTKETEISKQKQSYQQEYECMLECNNVSVNFSYSCPHFTEPTIKGALHYLCVIMGSYFKGTADLYSCSACEAREYVSKLAAMFGDHLPQVYEDAINSRNTLLKYEKDSPFTEAEKEELEEMMSYR